MKAAQRSQLVLFQRLMVIGLIGWHGLTYIKNHRSLVTTVTYNPHWHGRGCCAPLMFLQHCFQILTPQCWFRAENCFQPRSTLLKSYALLKFKYCTIYISSSFSRPCQRLRTASKREWDVCWRFQTLNFHFSSFVLNVPLTFLAGKGYERG